MPSLFAFNPHPLVPFRRLRRQPAAPNQALPQHDGTIDCGGVATVDFAQTYTCDLAAGALVGEPRLGAHSGWRGAGVGRESRTRVCLDWPLVVGLAPLPVSLTHGRQAHTHTPPRAHKHTLFLWR